MARQYVPESSSLQIVKPIAVERGMAEDSKRGRCPCSAGSAVDTFGTCKVDKPFVVVLGKVTGPFREYFLPVQD